MTWPLFLKPSDALGHAVRQNQWRANADHLVMDAQTAIADDMGHRRTRGRVHEGSVYVVGS